MMLVFYAAQDMGVALSGVAFVSACAVLMLGGAIAAAAFQNRMDGVARCAKCGYERPDAPTNEASEVCSECGHNWWDVGGAVSGERRPMWGVMALGAMVCVGGFSLIFLPGPGWPDRVGVRIASTDTLIDALPRSGRFDAELWMGELRTRRLSDDQRRRLSRALLGFESYIADTGARTSWLEEELKEGRLDGSLREDYFSMLATDRGSYFNSIPIDQFSDESLIVGATSGAYHLQRGACMAELIRRGAAESHAEVLAAKLLDLRREDERLDDVSARWLEERIGAGSLSSDLVERYYADLLDLWLEGEPEARAGDPYVVVIASRDRESVGGGVVSRVAFGGVSIDAGETWAQRGARWELGSLFGTRRYAGERRRSGEFAPIVRFDGPGVYEVVIRCWIVALPRDTRYDSRIEWLADGSARRPEGTLWARKVERRQSVRVRPR
jgi:hypothetical protein